MTAVAGITSTGRVPDESTCTLPNIPGRRRPSWFSNVALTRTFRVAASTSGLMVVISPSHCASANASVRRRSAGRA